MSNRDELAKTYALSKFPVQDVPTAKDFTQDINFARRMSHTQAFQDGWDACEKDYENHLKLFEESIRHSFKKREDDLKADNIAHFLKINELQGELAHWGRQCVKWTQIRTELDAALIKNAKQIHELEAKLNLALEALNEIVWQDQQCGPLIAIAEEALNKLKNKN